MEEPSPASRSPSESEDTHGFLFADLRGYTRLVERVGAVDASRLLERYRLITREVVAAYSGAEIKTEGDSFYVVVRSASAAVRCGLALVAACETPPDGGEPIAVGVGIHAGEAVSHEGGFVGSAVNIAARVCAEAGTGQLVATGTVRELTRSVVQARFVSLGRRRLKGLSDPVELFAVDRIGTAAALPVKGPVAYRARVAPSRRGVALTSGLGLVLVLGAVLAIRQLAAIAGPTGSAAGLGPSVTPLPTAASASPPSSGPVAVSLPRLGITPEIPNPAVPPGRYTPNANRDVAIISVDEGGWILGADQTDYLRLDYEPPGTRGAIGALAVLRISVTYTGPCSDAATQLIGDRPSDLIRWIQSAPQLDASAPRAVNDLGLPGVGIDATVRPLPSGACPASRNPTARLWQQGGGSMALASGSRFRIEALDDGAQTLVVFFLAPDRDTMSIFEVPARRLLGSMVLR